MSCQHEYIMRNGACAECGVTFINLSSKGDFFEKEYTFKPTNRSIASELTRFNQPDDICQKADEIYRKIGTPTKRGKERDKMLFFCLYSAYRESDIFANPQVLGQEMGLTNGDIARALTAFSEVQTGYRPKSLKTSPAEIIPQLCSSLGLDHISEEVIEILNDVIEKCPGLLEEFPHKVAAGALKYYMDINGIQIPNSSFHKVFCFSDITLKDVQERISMLHNS